MDFKTLINTVFNTKNTTVNNVAFLVGLVATVTLVLFAILKALLGGFFAFILVAVATGFFAYRTAVTNEALPAKDRESVRY